MPASKSCFATGREEGQEGGRRRQAQEAAIGVHVLFDAPPPGTPSDTLLPTLENVRRHVHGVVWSCPLAHRHPTVAKVDEKKKHPTLA